MIVGALTYGAGGWAFTLILLAFFVPSVALSRVGRARKKQLTDVGKSGARDALQVLANGGVATACAVLSALCSRSSDGSATAPSPRWAVAFAGAYAAATADTWGTEIGTLARGKPHSILTLRPIASGLSGGVTAAGTIAEVVGALWLAAASCSLLLRRLKPPEPAASAANDIPAASPGLAGRIFAAIALGGFIGATLDSLLGASLQELRSCPACERTCETNPHDCGTPTLPVRGIPGFSNDLVNFGATFSGAAVAFAAYRDR